MADTKVSDLSLVAPSINDLLYMVDDPGGIPVSAATTIAAVQALLDGLASTLANKTIVSPALSGTVSGVYTLGGTPTFPANVVLTAATQTLTGKTMSAANNTFTGLVNSNPTGIPGADVVTNMVSLTQAEYDLLTPNPSTFYVIVG